VVESTLLVIGIYILLHYMCMCVFVSFFVLENALHSAISFVNIIYFFCLLA
jgi:hypothetical protein